ncbi:MAG: hypothetical protein U9Q61_05295 [Thermodesulfobacteriota bacterium]|nr:hypothetical protein [Thermodesulfobacteriota bacterium]
MSESIEIKIIIDPSLANYFEDGIREAHSTLSVTEEMTEFLAMILNDSIYPMTSSKTNEQEIHLNYQPKSFADPIF